MKGIGRSHMQAKRQELVAAEVPWCCLLEAALVAVSTGTGHWHIMAGACDTARMA